MDIRLVSFIGVTGVGAVSSGAAWFSDYVSFTWKLWVVCAALSSSRRILEHQKLPRRTLVCQKSFSFFAHRFLWDVGRAPDSQVPFASFDRGIHGDHG